MLPCDFEKKNDEEKDQLMQLKERIENTMK